MEDFEEIESSGFFPSINQFRNAVRAERGWAEYHNVEPRKRVYVGTVKLHGTNAGITILDGEISYRSRSRFLTPEDDNHNFAKHMVAHSDEVLAFMLPLVDATVFGEWCGAGIQKSVGISAEQKMFVIFAAKVGHEWVDVKRLGNVPAARIFNIYDFPTWSMTIDFAHPEEAQNDLCALTEDVERQCPVAKAFGHDGIGEGIVWTPAEGEMGSRYWFKVKGEKHSSSKVKVLAAVDVERFRQRDELISAMVTDNRLKQALDLHVSEFKRPLDMTAIGDFLRWVFNDIIKEEADTIAASGFEVKELGKGISDKAKRFYVEAVNRA